MEKLPLLALVLQSFPEAVIFGVTGLCIVGVRPLVNRSLLFGALTAVSAYLIRQMPVPIGLHTLGYNLVAVLLLMVLYRIEFKKALAAAFLASALLILAEMVVLLLLLPKTNLSLEVVLAPENALLRVLVALPQLLIMGTTAYIAYRVRGRQLTDSIAASQRYSV